VFREVVRSVALVLTALALLGGSLAVAQPPAPGSAQVNEQDVYTIAGQLRCVVCQNLSVGDSPSEMANQMRGLIRERLAAGETPDQVMQYFVGKYGDWILLSPPRRGFTLLVWVLPYVAVLFGLVVVGWLIATWTRRGRRPAGEARPPVDSTMSERIRREMEAER
jgi:cytochrome c-type biogenesis protein CcmH